MTSDKPTYEELERRVRELESAKCDVKRAEEELPDTDGGLLSIFDGIDEPVYVSDPVTYEMIFVNRVLQDLFGAIGDKKCYEYLQHRDSPCPFCTNDKIFDETGDGSYVWEHNNEAAGRWYRCIDKAIRWPDGRRVRYEMAVDITDRKHAEEDLRQREESLATTLHSIGDGVISTDANGLVVNMNPVAENLCGWTLDDAVGKPLSAVFRIVNAFTRETVQDPVFQVLQTGRVFGLANHTLLLAKDGREYQIADSAAPIRDRKGEAKGVVLVFRDVTEQYDIEEKLRLSRERYDLAMEVKHEGVWDWNLITDETYFDDRYYTMAGYEPNDFPQDFAAWAERVHPDDLPKARKAIQVYLTGKSDAYDTEFRFRRKDNSWIWIRGRGKVFERAADGTPLRMVGTHTDVTERKGAESALNESEALLSNLFNSIQDGLSVLDRDLNVIKVNRLMEDWYAPNMPLVGKKCYECYQNADNPCNPCPALRSLESGKTETDTVRGLPGSSVGWIELYAYPIRDSESGETSGVVEFVRDITDRKESDDALKRSHNRLLTILDGIDATIYVADMDSHEILFMNKNMVDSFGRDLTGEICWDVFRGETGPCPHCTNSQLIDAEGKPAGLIVWQGKNPITGRWYVNYDRAIEWTDGRLVRIEIATDITELKEMEDQLRRSQRMEAIGTLAGGIAHNFNNVLMGIQGRASLMMMDKNSSSPDYEHLKEIEEYVRSAAELTKDLLGFARGGKYEVKPIDLNELIKQESSLFSRTRKEIRVVEKHQQDLWAVEADHGQIRQVLLNLYVNAWQAMPGGGDLYVYTENVTIDEEYVKPFDIAPGRYVKVSVTDTGTGMDDFTREKVFDPFFSTKDKREGSGLGLASVYGIVKNHGGFINVYSEKGAGTTFNVYLPASDIEPVQKGPIQDPHGIHYGQGTVLLVDDEAMILEVGRIMLEKLGYRVLVAAGGREALDIYGRQMEEIDLVILDMIMPGMNGGDVHDRLKAMNENVKVLLASGYSLNGQAKEIMDRGCSGFIQKPFALGELSRKVKELFELQNTASP